MKKNSILNLGLITLLAFGSLTACAPKICQPPKSLQPTDASTNSTSQDRNYSYEGLTIGLRGDAKFVSRNQISITKGDVLYLSDKSGGLKNPLEIQTGNGSIFITHIANESSGYIRVREENYIVDARNGSIGLQLRSQEWTLEKNQLFYNGAIVTLSTRDEDDDADNYKKISYLLRELDKCKKTPGCLEDVPPRLSCLTLPISPHFKKVVDKGGKALHEGTEMLKQLFEKETWEQLLKKLRQGKPTPRGIPGVQPVPNPPIPI